MPNLSIIQTATSGTSVFGRDERRGQVEKGVPSFLDELCSAHEARKQEAGHYPGCPPAGGNASALQGSGEAL